MLSWDLFRKFFWPITDKLKKNLLKPNFLRNFITHGASLHGLCNRESSATRTCLLSMGVKFPSLFACSMANSGFKGMYSLADIFVYNSCPPLSCQFLLLLLFLGTSSAVSSPQHKLNFPSFSLPLNQRAESSNKSPIQAWRSTLKWKETSLNFLNT